MTKEDDSEQSIECFFKDEKEEEKIIIFVCTKGTKKSVKERERLRNIYKKAFSALFTAVAQSPISVLACALINTTHIHKNSVN